MEIIAGIEDIVALSPDGEVRLDRFLCRTPGGLSRQQFARAVRDGKVRLNGRPAKPSSAVRPGDRIDLDPSCLSPANDHQDTERDPAA